jgi:Gpi18-like mannosyltransferase
MNKVLRVKQKILERDWRLALVLSVAFVVVALFIGYYSNLVIPGNSDPLARYSLEPATHLDFMSEWDGPHYLAIAKYGYSNNALTAFFPLYPLLIRLVMFIINSPLISGLLISWLCLFGAVYFYIRIIRELISKDQNIILLGLLLFLFFPTGIFLAATYTESLFAFLALGALFYGLKARVLPATIFSALATATHPEGVFVVALLGMLLIESKVKPLKIAAAVGGGSLGIVGYIIYLWQSKNRPLDFVGAQKGSHWLSANYFSVMSGSITVISALLFILVLISVFYWWKRRKSLALYSLLFVLLPLIGGNFAGYSRYSLMAFPMQLMFLDKFNKSRTGYPVVLMLSTILWTFYVIHYAAGYIGG